MVAQCLTHSRYEVVSSGVERPLWSVRGGEGRKELPDPALVHPTGDLQTGPKSTLL